ncbi:MAG TPA: UDP-N-acetylglucosamine--N-acetylmuramyl-(pentapeptide) pyrophosphoryl-undecaprenol N-acetylglucosamine transferase, partial [Microvirga sp.]|nr:UDP-N-acetylglucosamine--N-acetylmuramyl-(pentapeptide) pyrophosphoryl-undecaprenol N-acetylglucosamine transferase [Microvirga sp.]
SGRSPLRMASAGIMLGLGVAKAVPAIRRMKPGAVVGFGGYPTVPPVMAAALLGVPAIIHEQNGVMGRANRLLARWASMIATGFPTVTGIPAGARGRIVHTGNPVRPAVLEASEIGYPPVLKGGKMRLLVFGGSQGARVMSDVVPNAIERLPKELYPQLVIAQQAREEDLLRVRAHYSRLLVRVEVQPFFRDMPRRMADAHLVIARSGASTVAELAVIGRPSILVPLPGALDQDQAANARVLAEIDAALVMPQTEFTPERLAAAIRGFFDDPDRLARAAAAAKGASITDAAERLAQAVLLQASQNKGRPS